MIGQCFRKIRFTDLCRSFDTEAADDVLDRSAAAGLMFDGKRARRYGARQFRRDRETGMRQTRAEHRLWRALHGRSSVLPGTL